MYFFDDEQDINVIDALKKYGRMSEQMQEIIHQAKLLENIFQTNKNLLIIVDFKM